MGLATLDELTAATIADILLPIVWLIKAHFNYDDRGNDAEVALHTGKNGERRGTRDHSRVRLIGPNFFWDRGQKSPFSK